MFHTLYQLKRGSLGRAAAVMLRYRRHWQLSTCLTLFFLQIKQANNGAQLGARQAHRQQFILVAAGSDALYNFTALLLNVEDALWINRYRLLRIESGCSEPKQP